MTGIIKYNVKKVSQKSKFHLFDTGVEFTFAIHNNVKSNYLF